MLEELGGEGRAQDVHLWRVCRRSRVSKCCERTGEGRGGLTLATVAVLGAHLDELQPEYLAKGELRFRQQLVEVLPETFRQYC